MKQQIYRGDFGQEGLAQYLLDTWNQGNTAAQILEAEEGLIIQIGQRSAGFFRDDPASAATVAVESVAEGCA